MPRLAPLILLACALMACSAARPDPVVSPLVDSGVTSSGGGGGEMLGRTPNVGVTTRTGR